MRQIFLDTETTGKPLEAGHRIIEIGCLEMQDRRFTHQTFHCYLNPDRAIEAEARRVHGLTEAFLQDKPHFGDIADDFLRFIQGAQLVIHNAPFDLGFLNMELARIGRAAIETVCPDILDTLALDKEIAPGREHNLDALCNRYEIDHSHRTYHGALLDAELLADVYLAMTRRQEALDIALYEDKPKKHKPILQGVTPVQRATAEELAAHEAVLARIEQQSGNAPLWRQLMSEANEATEA